MFASALLALREGLEAALVLGVIIGALYKFDRERLIPAVWLGAGVAGILSLLAAIALYRVGAELEGDAEKIFEGTTMLLAAGVLTWMIFWMKRKSSAMSQSLEADVSTTGKRAPFLSLFFLALIVVIREGVELGLFLTAAAFSVGGSKTLFGAGLGLATAAILGWLLYASSIQLDLKRFFKATSILLLIFAAGLVAHGVHEFNEIGWIPAVVDPLWNINHILDEASIPGQLLKTLVGYNSSPSLTEALAYVGYLAFIVISLRLMTIVPARRQPA